MDKKEETEGNKETRAQVMGRGKTGRSSERSLSNGSYSAKKNPAYTLRGGGPGVFFQSLD